MSNKKNKYKKRTYQKNSRLSLIKAIQNELTHPLRLNKPKWTKRSMILAAVVAVLMAGIAVYSWITADEGFTWLWLSAAVIAATFVINLVDFEYSDWLEILLTLFAPSAVFMLVESYTHLLSQMRQGPVFLNLVMYYLFFALLIFITGRTGRGIIIGSALLAVAGLANYFVLLFRSSPILPWDLYSVGVAATVADNFEYTLSVKACDIILLFIMLWMLCRKMHLKFSLSRFRVAGMAVMCVGLLSFCKYVQTDAAASDWHIDTTLFTPTVLYRNNGLVLSFVVNMRYLDVSKPDGYSEEYMALLQEELTGDDSGEATEYVLSDDSPNIIVIMNEAFSDLSILGDYETNVEVMPFISSLTENTQKGWLYTSVKGGNTANTEFEFLTGLSMYFLPTGSIPYQQYIRSELPSLASQLSGLGYTSIAVHPYYASGWNRDTVYDYLGFDEKYFINDLKNVEKLRIYTSDWSVYENIISRYESRDEDEKLFTFAVTMQNHGSYVRFYDNYEPDVEIIDGTGTYLEAAEQYLSLIKTSDEAFEQLVEYFSEQEEPTIILMFGDHQPADYITNVVDDGNVVSDWGDTTKESTERKERYIVPYILWANYDIEESADEETSANYLGGQLLETAQLPLTDFQEYLEELSETIPVISATAIHILDEDEGEELLETYNYLQYNDLFDGRNRLEDFFNLLGN